MSEGEVWKDIEGFEGWYKVSNLGNVKSLDRIVTYSDGRRYKYKGKRIALTPNLNRSGYLYVTLVRNGMRKNFKVHRLVAETFIPNIDNKPHVNHIDGDKTNNSVGNLEWVTPKENIEHAVKMGLIKAGADSHMSRFTQDEVNYMRKAYRDGIRQSELAKEFNTNDSTIFQILKRKTYKNI